MASYLSSFTLLLVIFNIVVTSKLSTGTRNHAYFSTNEDSQYIGDNIPVTFHKEFTGTPGKISIDESLFNSRIHLKFLPPVLDFKERHLGIPHHERVTIINLSCNRTILMSSISGSTVHFHSSFFQDKIIPPLGNTSFSVVFLGRGEGEIKSYLYIHTSEGSFKYQVKGESVGSPYRLRSLSGIKIPLNATYTPEIFMHNPHPTVLQILEVYSSGHEFHLELPSGDLGGPKHIWQIPAFFTKPIIRLKFHATSQKNHSAYVRLKLDRGEQILMIPVDVEVGSVCGLYSSDDLINFGLGGTKDPPKKIKLFLKNSSKKPMRVLLYDIKKQREKIIKNSSLKNSIRREVKWKSKIERGLSSASKLKIVNISSVTTSPLSKALKIDFKPSVVPPRSKTPTEVAVLTFDWQTAYKTGLTSGSIIVKSSQYNQKLVMRYYATVLEGGLEYDSSQLKFKSDESEILPRLVNLQNNFKVPVVITGVSLRQSAAPYFQIKNFSSTSILPGETKSIFIIEAKNNFLNSNLRIESGIHISTNASALVVPLLCFNGKLKKVSTWETNDTFFSIGSVNVGDQKLFYFGLINENPIEVHITSLNVNISDADIGIVAVERGNATRAMHAIAAEYSIDFKKELHLAPRSYCVVQVTIPGQNIGHTYGRVSIMTNFESLNIDIKLQVNEANDLEVWTSANNFENCIQNDICPSDVTLDFPVPIINSNYKRDSDHSIGFLSSSHDFPLSKKYVHYYSWNTNETTCYIFSNLTGHHKHYNSLHFPSLPNRLDINMLLLHYESYLKLSAELMKLTYWLNTSHVTNMNFNSLMKPDWPSLDLIESRFVQYPSPYIGNSSYQDMAPDPPPVPKLMAQLVLEPSYYGSDSFQASNNLSTHDGLKHNAIKGQGQLKFNGKKPGSYTVLLFELTEKHLRACERNNDKRGNKPVISVRRSFFAKNTGFIPLSVIGFTINGQPCEGYGFLIINCEPFILPANSSKKIDIAFTPDFTLSKINRLLTIMTIDSSVNYTLTATLPPYLLSQCSNFIQRPTWEPLVYYSAVSFMLFLLICVLGAAYFESNRILRNTIITLSRDNNLQPVLDLRMIGSEAMNSPEQNSVHSESQCKIIWTSNAYSEEQVAKDIQKPITESIFTINCSNKCQILNNGINCKKKSERTICKRFADGTENYIEKTCWETSFSRTNSSQPMKTSICITTEPYIPLTNIKTRDPSIQKSEFSSSKYDQSRFIEFQRRKTKKKSQALNNYDLPKKKSVSMAPIRNMFEESESSPTTSESSCSDGEKDVESMFFQSVRHHLQSKVTRGRHIKLSTSSSPLMKRKKSLEKPSVNVMDHDWDIDEDESCEKATVVRNNRRSSSSVKQIKKQAVNYGKMRFDQSQSKGKQAFGERSIKCCLRKEKTQTSKKRSERMEKRVSSAKATTMMVTHDLVPAVPSPPVWTASFSDVVAGTESSYSSVVATKSNSSSTQNQKHQLNICSQDSGSSCSGSSVTNYSSSWKTEYQDALEQQESSNEHVSEIKNPLNNIWSNWSSLAESIQAQSSTNSLFTDGSTQNANSYDPLWNDHNVMKVMQDSQEIDNNLHGVRNEINWPILTSLWEPLYTPSSAVETPPPVWGSDVWGPPISPTATQPQPSSDDVVQNNLEYDPFRSLSNIWAQHSPNIWKPPTSE